MSIRLKILLAIMLAVIMSIVGITGMVSRELDQTFIQNFRTNSHAQLARMSAFVGIFFRDVASSVELLAKDPFVMENIDSLSVYVDTKEDVTPIGAQLPVPERDIFGKMQLIADVFSQYLLVYVANNQGGMTQAPDDFLSAGYNPAKRPWYLDTVKAGKTIITEAYISDSGDAVCTIASPVLVGGKIRGVAAVDISLNTLTKETGNVNIGETGYVIVLDSLGQVISDPKNSGENIPEQDRWLGKKVGDLPGDTGKALTSLFAVDSGSTEVAFGGKTRLASVQTTAGGWKLIILQDKEEIFAAAMRVTLVILSVGLVIVLLMLGITWFVTLSFTKPLTMLTNAAESVADGNLQAIPRDGALFKAELGILHQSLLRMVTKLTELIATADEKIKEAEEALSQSRESLQEAEEAKKLAEVARHEGIQQAANRLDSVILQLTSTTERLVETADHIGRRADEQLHRVEGVTSSIVKMNSAVNDVASSTTRTARLAEDARNEAGSGKTLVLDVIRQTHNIETQSAAMNDSLTNLGKQADDIGQIMSVISDIADQTNLLALNAAIEAARAGEAGRGFAVVADEVRKLAEKTVNATKQVEDAIKTIQGGTAANVSSMKEVFGHISEAARVAQQAGEALSGIESMVDRTAGEIRAIATASEEQSASLEGISNSAGDISGIAQEVAEGSRHSGEEAHKLAEISQHLNRIVSDLKKE